MNKKSQREMSKDVEENEELYQALADGHGEIDIQAAKKRCQKAMRDVSKIEDAEVRCLFEIHLQHIYADLYGDKEELYKLC